MHKVQSFDDPDDAIDFRAWQDITRRRLRPIRATWTPGGAWPAAGRDGSLRPSPVRL